MKWSVYPFSLPGIELLFLVQVFIFGTANQVTPPSDARETEPEILSSNMQTNFSIIPTNEPMKGKQELEVTWITEIFGEARRVFDVDSATSKQCRRDYEVYKSHLRNQTVWAIRMFESSEWPSTGLLSGKTYHLGDWDECVKASGPGFRGQYCMVDININVKSHSNTTNDTSSFVQWPREDSSAWDVIEMFARTPYRLDRHKIKWAICIPSSCTPADLEKSLNHTSTPIFQKHEISISITVDPLLCSMHRTTYSAGFYLTCALFFILIGTVISSSIYDIFNNKFQGELTCWLPIKLFKCFSIRQNYINLTRYSSAETTNPGIHLIKVIHIIFVINGHRLYNVLAYPTFPTELVETKYQLTHAMLVSLFVVDVFFMLSGFLTFQFGYTPMKKKGHIFLYLSVFFRLLRMLPLLGLLILFVAFILPHIGEGPLWNYRIIPTVEMCKDTWWTNLMAVGNIFKAEKQWMPIIWYVSVDIQLSILGGILLLLITKRKKIGAITVFATFLLATEILGILVYRRKYDGSFLLHLKTFRDYREIEEFYRLYTLTISRVGPYLVGFAAAFLAKILKDRQYTFSGKQTILILLGTFVIGLAAQYYGLLFYYNHSRPTKHWENAVYAALKQPLFVLPLASLLCIYFTSGLGKFNKFFECRIWVPYGRLVYSVFLVHYVIQMYHASSQRQFTLTPATLNEYWLLCADTINSFFIGFILYMIAEGPVNRTSKLLQSYLIRPEIRTIPTCQEGIQNKAFKDTEAESSYIETASC